MDLIAEVQEYLYHYTFWCLQWQDTSHPHEPDLVSLRDEIERQIRKLQSYGWNPQPELFEDWSWLTQP